MTLLRTRLLPFVLAGALFAPGGCGLLIEEGPTDATLATMNGLQAITEAIATAVLPGDVSGTTLPYSTGATAPADQGEFAAFGNALVQALGGTSERLVTTDYTFALSDPSPPQCVTGTVALEGTATMNDNRTPTYGPVNVVFNNLTAEPSACSGYGHTSTGSMIAGADDTITISQTGDPQIDYWVVDRDESAYGTLTVIRDATGAAYPVNFNWHRLGNLNLTVDYRNTTPYVTVLSQNQTLYLNVNNQSCTGHYTGRVFNPYNWDCSGG